MGKFNKKGGFSDRGGDRRDRQMHRAVCSECGKNCEVPFRPTGDKPVFCSDCFSQREGSGGSRFDRRDSGRSGFGDKKMFQAVCDKCHKDCEVPFRPTGDKPIFCSDCFGKTERGGGSKNVGSSDQYKKQFEMLNSKLDSILKILSPKASAEKIVKEDAVIKIDKKAPEKKVETKKKAVAPKKSAKKVATKKKK